MSLAQKASTHSWNSRSGASSARKKEEGREPAALEPMFEVLLAEVLQVLRDHRRERHLRLATGEGIPELRRGAEGRGARRQDAQLRKVIGGDLQELRGIPEAMDFVEHHPLSR